MTSTNIRIYRLARELALDSKTIVRWCHQLNIGVKTHSSSLTPPEAEQIRSAAASIQAADPPPRSEEQGQPGAVAIATPHAPQPTVPVTDLSNPTYYLNRELSWLRFNQRVLHEAFDPRTPLLERLKFLAIYSANLDEYFMLRVSGLKQQVEAHVTQRSLDGLTAQEQLALIHQHLKPEVQRQHHYFNQTLRQKLIAAEIHLLNYGDLSEGQTAHLHQYFLDQIFPILTPLAVDPAHPFPYISNLSLNLAVVIKAVETGEVHFARVKVPNMLPRFVVLPHPELAPFPCQWWGVPIEQVIAHNLALLFQGMEIQACHPFRITRNADLELEEAEADDLLLALEEELRKRRFGTVVRMEILLETPPLIRHTLMREMSLQEEDVYEVEGILGLRDLFGLASLPFPALKDPPWTPIVPQRLHHLEPLDPEVARTNAQRFPLLADAVADHPVDIFAVIRAGDLLVHHPYDSFTATVQRFITQAAEDPDVLTIKITLYRTAGDSGIVDSPIVSSLIAAAENGKQVVALVELKARFDEANNIQWARKLERVGVHVVYGLVGLKTHTKIALVVRREADQLRRYVHIGTGNYNPKTARLYTDLGLLSCREDLGADLTDLFNYLTGFARHQAYRKLLVAPMNLRDRFLYLIDREINHQYQGSQGRIIAKMNSLIDPKIMVALYRASQAGVQIDLIVRGICSLRPQLEGISDNIRVISIIGQFLEHDRIFYFHNQGEPTVLIGSADWRARNLDRRVEAVVPIEDPQLVTQLRQLLEHMLRDERQAWELRSDGQYVQRQPRDHELVMGIQAQLMQQALETNQELSFENKSVGK